MLLCLIGVECQTMEIHSTPAKKKFPDWCRYEFGSSKKILNHFTSIFYDRTLAEAAKKAALPHCC